MIFNQLFNFKNKYNEVFKDLAEVVNAEINVEVNKNQLNLKLNKDDLALLMESITNSSLALTMVMKNW